MFTTVSTSLDTSTLTALLAQCEHSGTDLSATIARAVTHWLAAQAAGPGSAATEAGVTEAGGCGGYQWKSLYLPEGTILRSWSYGDCRDAEVVGGRILHAGRSVSPNQFARSFARTVRNAWKDLSIRRPGDAAFHSAWRLRRDLAAPPDVPLKGPKPDIKEGAQVDKKAGTKAGKKTGKKAGKKSRQAAATATGSPSVSASPSASALTSPSPSPSPSALSSAPARPVPSGAGWNLPERRKMRFRLEDIAFD